MALRTARQRAALRKAQLASARKRRGRGRGKLRRGAKRIKSGYKKYDRAVTRTKSKARAKGKRLVKKYPRTARGLATASVIGAVGANYAYYRYSPYILNPAGHPVPNPLRKR
jgi:hypothetical protein